MVRTRHGDYSRVEEYLQEIADDIEMETGEKFEDLDRESQIQTLLEHFFRGIPQYWQSAEDMRDGIIYTQRHRGAVNVTVGRIHRRGHTYRVVRDGQTGRIRQWVRE